MIDRRPLGNVLVGTDFSDGGRRAVDRAARLPMTRGSTLTVLHVMPKLHPSLFARAEAAARQAVERQVDAVRAAVAAGVDVLGALTSGEPFVEISARADSERVELIVLGRHGRRGWLRGVLGTTADRVLRATTTATLVVSDDPLRPYRRPMFAVDREGAVAGAIAVLAHVVAPEVRGALAVHVLDANESLLPIEYGLTAAEMARQHERPEAIARGEIEPALDALCGTELDYDLRCVEGVPAPTILELARAEQVDLIALGTHGRSGLRRMLVGSVAGAVVRDSEIDTLVARSGEHGWSA